MASSRLLVLLLVVIAVSQVCSASSRTDLISLLKRILNEKGKNNIIKRQEEATEPDCSLAPDSGHCLAAFQRFYYDPSEKKCKTFTYGGCGGNSNNFRNEEECVTACRCTPPAETGMCRAYFPRFHFNQETNACESFVYGGCGGNGNNFKTAEECTQVCVDACSLPAESGPCRAYMPMFHFNAASGQCEQFIFGGCAGNANRFVEKAACEAACISKK